MDAAEPRRLRTEVRALLLEWDAVGTMDDPAAPRSEYDCMIDPLLGLLRASAGVAGLVDWMTHERETHFGLHPDLTADRLLAERLVAWWLLQSVRR